MIGAASAGAPEKVADDPRCREILTPEGVSLSVRLASRGDRVSAFLLDFLIMVATLIVLIIVIAIATAGFRSSGAGFAIFLLLSFVLRAFYFTFFELRWRGRTPGKRILGLRVIDRSGGPLRADAVFARNLMREVEIFMPITLVMSLAGTEDGEGWTVLLSLLWVGVFSFMPFFNKDNLRVGDMVGGTWVVVQPRGVLLPDMAEAGSDAEQSPANPASTVEYVFGKEHLSAYGIYELQTLENILRMEGNEVGETQIEVCRRIQKKIGWTANGPVHPRRFLEAFYAAQRAHLEQSMMMGVRRENKFDRKK